MPNPPPLPPPTPSCCVQKMRDLAVRLNMQMEITNYEWPQRLLFSQHQQIILWLTNSSSPNPRQPEIIGVDIDIIEEGMLLDTRYNERMRLQHGRQARASLYSQHHGFNRFGSAMLTPRALFQNLCQCPMHGVPLFCFKEHIMKVAFLPLQYSLLPPRPPLLMLNHLQLYLSTYFTSTYTYPPTFIPFSVSCSLTLPPSPSPSTSEELLSITVLAHALAPTMCLCNTRPQTWCILTG